MKKSLDLWWDFRDNKIIVETNNDKYPVIAEFTYENQDASKAIIDACALIQEVNSGRVTIKSLLKEK